jgi:hypothetical protein
MSNENMEVKDLRTAVDWLEALLKVKGKLEVFKRMDEGDLVGEHHRTGRFIRNTLKLWEKDSVLSAFFRREYSLWHADDMSHMILVALHRKLREMPMRMDDVARELLAFHKRQDVG